MSSFPKDCLQLISEQGFNFSSLLGLVSLFEKATAVKKLARDGFASKRSITHVILGLF